MHLAGLHARKSVVSHYRDRRPVGFVEPNAAFFGYLRRLVERANAFFTDCHEMTELLIGAKDTNELWRKYVTMENNRARRADLKEAWAWLVRALQSLEAIAEKELKEAEMNDEDRKFLKKFGSKLDLYLANVYYFTQRPRACVIDIHFDAMRSAIFHVATGFPKEICVLYPWKGKRIFCRGVVWPYYEFEEDGIVNDDEWMRRLRLKDKPQMPRWVRELQVESK